MPNSSQLRRVILSQQMINNKDESLARCSEGWSREPEGGFRGDLPARKSERRTQSQSNLQFTAFWELYKAPRKVHREVEILGARVVAYNAL